MAGTTSCRHTLRTARSPRSPRPHPILPGLWQSVYDGGDQEFWRQFYTWHELPLRYQAHQALNMPHEDWHEVRVLHSISALREVNKIPKDMRSLIKYFY